METRLDLSRWKEAPRGVGYRRWAIASTGLRQIFRLRFFKVLFGLAWLAGTLMALFGFLFSQSVAPGGWFETYATHFGVRAEAMVSALNGFVALYPDICIGGLFTVIFWLHAVICLWLTLLALTVMVPGLVTRDRATHALTVYLSRPLTSADYLIGKLGVIGGVIGTIWTGPLVAGWLLSMLFAPDRDFLVYSFTPFLHALLFNAVGTVALAAIALGVSAVSRTSRNTVLLWLGLWLVAGIIASPPGTSAWIRDASFSHDLGVARAEIFQLGDALVDAGGQLPLTNRNFADNLVRWGKASQEYSEVPGALVGLGLLSLLASAVFFRRLQSE
jgi:ABC-2 type transport system permease protein